MTGVVLAVEVAVAVAFMLLLPRVVVVPPPTRTVTELEVLVTVWLPVVVAFEAKVEVMASKEVSPLSRVTVLG